MKASKHWNRMNMFSKALKPKSADPNKPRPQFSTHLKAWSKIELEDEEVEFYHDGRRVSKGIRI